MEFLLNFEKETPLYQQLREQILVAVAKGVLRPGDGLPSVRALGEQLEINMHTVNKAYLLLRDEGYLTLDRRSGARIASQLERSSGDIEQELADKLLVLAAQARCRGLGRKEFRRIAGDVYDTLKSGERET